MRTLLNKIRKQIEARKQFLAAFALAAVVAVSANVPAHSAHALDLTEYDNLTATSGLSFANDFVGALYTQLGAILPFFIQVGIVLIILALVFGIPWLIWRFGAGFFRMGRGGGA